MKEQIPQSRPGFLKRLRGKVRRITGSEEIGEQMDRIDELGRDYINQIRKAPNLNTMQSLESEAMTKMVAMGIDNFMELYKVSSKEKREVLVMMPGDEAQENFRMFAETGKDIYRTHGTYNTRVTTGVNERLKTFEDTPISEVEPFRVFSPKDRLLLLSIVEKDAQRHLEKYQKSKNIKDLREAQYHNNVIQSIKDLIAELDTKHE